MKTVTLPIDEYNELLQDQNDKKRLKRELEADAKDRGYYVQKMTHMYDQKIYECTHFAEIEEKSRVMIISKDDVLAKAQKELDRLEKMCEEQSTKIKKLERENLALRCRGFWARVFNKED